MFRERGKKGSQRLIARARRGNLEDMAGDGEKKTCTTSNRGGNIKSSDRRICRDTQRIHPSRRSCVGKNKRGGGGMVKRLGKEEEKKNVGNVE